MVANVLTIAGSDSGGGAGIQADLKSFSAQGAYGATVITAITAQNTQSVTAVQAIPVDVVRAQIDAVLSDIQIGAIKIGMLGMPDMIETVADALSEFDGPIVLDPVMVSKSGASLLPDEAVDVLRSVLLPRAAVITPNIPEAAVLLKSKPAETLDDVKAQGIDLKAMFGCAVLMKGGHSKGDICTDLLLSDAGVCQFFAPRVDTKNTHGTGCSYSAAIAALMAGGLDVRAAVKKAHHWLQGAILNADTLSVGQGYGPVHHFYQAWK